MPSVGRVCIVSKPTSSRAIERRAVLSAASASSAKDSRAAISRFVDDSATTSAGQSSPTSGASVTSTASVPLELFHRHDRWAFEVDGEDLEEDVDHGGLGLVLGGVVDVAGLEEEIAGAIDDGFLRKDVGHVAEIGGVPV